MGNLQEDSKGVSLGCQRMCVSFVEPFSCPMGMKWRIVSHLSAIIFLLIFNYPLYVQAKVVTGLAKSNADHVPIADFCYNMPGEKTGKLLSKVIANSHNYDLIVLNSSVAYQQYDCLEMTSRARLREPIGAKASEEPANDVVQKQPVAQELDLTISPSFSGEQLTAMFTHCEGKGVDAIYELQFLNPGGFFYRHFSCEEQGLLQLYTVLLTLYLLLFPFFKRLQEDIDEYYGSLHTQQATPTSLIHTRITPDSPVVTSSRSVPTALYLSSLLYMGVMSLSFLHIVAYAFNGIGFPLFSFLSRLFSSIFNCFIMGLLIVLRGWGVEGKNSLWETEELWKLPNGIGGVLWAVFIAMEVVSILIDVPLHWGDLGGFSAPRNTIGAPLLIYRCFLGFFFYKTHSAAKGLFDVRWEHGLLMCQLLWTVVIPALIMLGIVSSLQNQILLSSVTDIAALLGILALVWMKKVRHPTTVSLEESQLLDSRRPYIEL